MVLAQVVKALIRNWHPALIRVNGAEGEVICSSLAFGQHIKKCRFPTKTEKYQQYRSNYVGYDSKIISIISKVYFLPDIWQPNNANFQGCSKSSN